MAGDASWGRTGSGRKRPRTLQPWQSARPWAPSEETSVATCLVTFAEIGKPRGFALLGSDRGWNPFLSPALPPGRGRCRLPVRGQWRPPLWPLCRTPDAAPGRGQRARAQCRLAPNGAARAPPPSRGGGWGWGRGQLGPGTGTPRTPGHQHSVQRGSRGHRGRWACSPSLRSRLGPSCPERRRATEWTQSARGRHRRAPAPRPACPEPPCAAVPEALAGGGTAPSPASSSLPPPRPSCTLPEHSLGRLLPLCAFMTGSYHLKRSLERLSENNFR